MVWRLKFGERNIVQFSSEERLFEAIGFLANSNRGIRFDFERYDNKWGIEGRIWIKNSSGAPLELRRSFSAGTNYVDARLNCNDFIVFLLNMGFQQGSFQDVNRIISFVPFKYREEFESGYRSR